MLPNLMKRALHGSLYIWSQANTRYTGYIQAVLWKLWAISFLHFCCWKNVKNNRFLLFKNNTLTKIFNRKVYLQYMESVLYLYFCPILRLNVYLKYTALYYSINDASQKSYCNCTAIKMYKISILCLYFFTKLFHI